MKKRAWLLWLVLVLLVGCGGGGGSTDEPVASGSNSAPPFVLDMYPADNATGVSLNSIVRAVIDSDPNPATVIPQNCKITQALNSVGGTVSLVGNIIDIRPANLLLPNTIYTVTISDLQNQYGKKMPAPRVWTFTTGAVPDTTPPKIIIVSPSSGTVVAVTTTLSVTFDEPIDPSSVNHSTFTVTDIDTGVAVNGTLALNEIGKTATFTPAANLAFSNHYDVKLQGIKDLSGNAFSLVPSIWEFSTVAVPVVTTFTLATTNWIAYSKGGNTQATFDKSAGKVTVNIVGEASDVSVKWAPLNIIRNKPYRVSFPCDSVPQKNVVVQLKRNGGDYYAYDSLAVACTGTVKVDMIPDGDDPLGRFNINFGAESGVYDIGPVTITH